MIKIELQFETGAEAREALIELLGSTPVPEKRQPYTLPDGQETPQEIAETFLGSAPEQEKKKRRTKAQIEADQAKQSDPSDDVQNEPASEEPKVTVEDLQKKAIELGRAGKKEDCRAILKKYGASSISSDNKLDPAHYAEVLAEFNEL